MRTVSMLVVWISVAGCTDDREVPCPATAYAAPEVACDPSDGTGRDGVMVSGVCSPRCADAGAVCMTGEVFRTFTTVEDACAVGHVCYCTVAP